MTTVKTSNIKLLLQQASEDRYSGKTQWPHNEDSPVARCVVCESNSQRYKESPRLWFHPVMGLFADHCKACSL